jgi:asparagine synthase (glutamine-hydrolysing)
MADVLLRDSDVMSMRHSLELRVPFVDRPFVEWLRQQPAVFRHDAGRPKSALYDATRDLLPPALAQRAKRGFTLPFPLWMRRELRPFLEETFSDASVGQTGLFDRAAVQQFWTGFLQRDDHREWSRVWSLAVLISFVNRPFPLAHAG